VAITGYASDHLVSFRNSKILLLYYRSQSPLETRVFLLKSQCVLGLKAVFCLIQQEVDSVCRLSSLFSPSSILRRIVLAIPAVVGSGRLNPKTKYTVRLFAPLQT